MFKKTMLFAAALAMIVSLAGCACSGTVAPTPTPSLAPVATPTAEIIEPSPDIMTSPDAMNSPDAQKSPDASASTSPDTNGNPAGGTGGTSIKDFKEGTEVKEADVPEIASAVKAKYENAKIKSIKHAMRENKQVYEVEITSGSTTQTVYVQPDGTVMEK